LTACTSFNAGKRLSAEKPSRINVGRGFLMIGVKCPKCGGELRRWVEGDEPAEDAYWVACRCERCGYVLKIKHVD